MNPVIDKQQQFGAQRLTELITRKCQMAMNHSSDSSEGHHPLSVFLLVRVIPGLGWLRLISVQLNEMKSVLENHTRPNNIIYILRLPSFASDWRYSRVVNCNPKPYLQKYPETQPNPNLSSIICHASFYSTADKANWKAYTSFCLAL